MNDLWRRELSWVGSRLQKRPSVARIHCVGLDSLRHCLFSGPFFVGLRNIWAAALIYLASAVDLPFLY